MGFNSLQEKGLTVSLLLALPLEAEETDAAEEVLPLLAERVLSDDCCRSALLLRRTGTCTCTGAGAWVLAAVASSGSLDTASSSSPLGTGLIRSCSSSSRSVDGLSSAVSNG